MVRVTIYAGAADEKVGTFTFDQLPRCDEEVVVPWPDEPGGTRIFTVTEVVHTAFGAPEGSLGFDEKGPTTVIRGEEVT